MTEKTLDVQTILTMPIPEKPVFGKFLNSLRSAGLPASVKDGILTVEIADQNIEHVRNLVKALLGDEEIKKMEAPLAELSGLSDRTRNALTNNNIHTVRDLLNSKWGCWHGVGRKCEREIRIALHNIGIEANILHGRGILNPEKHEIKDPESKKRISGWFAASSLAQMFPQEIPNTKVLTDILEPLAEKFPHQIGWFEYGAKRKVFKIHPELANKIIIICKTKSDLEAFVKSIV